MAKPTPPVIPGAQLKLDVYPPDVTDVDRRELRQLWEDEYISYLCFNTSLVLDHQVGLTEVSNKNVQKYPYLVQT